MPLQSNLDSIADELLGAIRRGAERTARDVLSLERQLTPVDTGDLKASERVEPAGDRGPASFNVVAGGVPGKKRKRMVNYAKYVEDDQPFASAAAREIDPALRVKAEIVRIVRRGRV